MKTKRDSIVFFFFLLTLFFSPLAFGATENWSLITIELFILLSVLFFYYPFFRKETRQYRVPGGRVLLLLLAYIFLQTLPLPTPVVHFIAPNIFHSYQPVLDSSGLSSFDILIPLTVNRRATLYEILRIGSYVFFYVLTVQLLTSHRRLVVTVKALSALAISIAFLSILQRITAPDTLFWFRKLADGKTAFGPWVYKNHYAGFMVMLLPLVFSLFVLYRPVFDDGDTFRAKMLAVFSGSGAIAYFIWGFGCVVILTSVFLTQSRGGILSVSSSLLCFFLLVTRQQQVGKSTYFVLVPAFLVLVGWYSWEPIIERFSLIVDPQTGGINDDRLLIWADSLRIIADFPFTGSGFGTFVDIFPSYKTLQDNLLYDHAHNDFLEIFTDGGFVAGTLSLFFISRLLIGGYKSIQSRRDRLSVLLSCGALSGIAGLLVYSLFDFNLHNGANGLYFFFFCGLLVSAGSTRRHYQNSPTLLGSVASPQRVNRMYFIAVFIFFSATLLLHGRAVLTERYYQQAKIVASRDNIKPLAKIEAMAAWIHKANQMDPLNGVYSYALANLKKLQKKNDEAVSLSAEAVLREPMNFSYLQQLGGLVASNNLHQGRRLLELGYIRADQKFLAFQVWVDFELTHYQRDQGQEGQEGLLRIRTVLKQDPRLLHSLYPLLMKYELSQKELVAVLPEQTSAWFSFWIQLKQMKRTDDYPFVVTRFLEYVDNEPILYPHYFTEGIRFYQQKNNEKKVFEVLQLGIRYLPNYAPFHVLLGEIYLKKGKDNQALGAYKRALLLDPNNKEIQRMIKKFGQVR